jgi:hypothetical protein
MYQLVLRLPAASMADYDAVVALEERLVDGLGDDAVDVDGHDVGGGIMNLFIWTPDPRGTFGRAQMLMKGHPLSASVVAGFRDEGADEYTPLWPPELKRFDLL